MYERRLEEYGIKVQELSVEELLSKITDRGRLERAKKIKDEEIAIEESSQERIKAKTRKYRIELDLGVKVLRHDCDDWKKGLRIKRICKHVVKLFMMIPKEESREVLADIIKNKDDWRFQVYAG